MTGLIEDEECRPVVGWEGLYEVSDQGRIKSLERSVLRSDGRRAHVRERILKQFPSGPDRNYLFVVLSDRGLQTPKKTHRLVLEAFVGSCPEGMEGCHGPGGVSDNRLSNLRWATRSANIQDQVEAGTHYSHGRTKTHCPQQHEYTPENTGFSLIGDTQVRYCRECKRVKSALRRDKRKNG